MVDINYLEDERKKLWEKVVEQDKQIVSTHEYFLTTKAIFKKRATALFFVF